MDLINLRNDRSQLDDLIAEDIDSKSTGFFEKLQKKAEKIHENHKNSSQIVLINELVANLITPYIYSDNMMIVRSYYDDRKILFNKDQMGFLPELEFYDFIFESNDVCGVNIIGEDHHLVRSDILPPHVLVHSKVSVGSVQYYTFIKNYDDFTDKGEYYMYLSHLLLTQPIFAKYIEEKKVTKVMGVESLIRGVAHDIVSPMGNIYNALNFVEEELKSDSSDKEEIFDMLNLAQSSVLKVSEFVKTSLDPQHLNSYLKISAVNLYDVVENIFERSCAHFSDLELINDVPPDTIIFAERNSLDRLLTNFVDNAIKHTKEGYVKVYFNEAKDALLDKLGAGYRIFVEDTGTGISTNVNNIDDLKKIRRTKGVHDESSNGMGFLIVKNILDKYRGAVIGEKTATGTLFEIQIPEYELGSFI